MSWRTFVVIAVTLALAAILILLQRQRVTRLEAEIGALQSQIAATNQDAGNLEKHLKAAPNRTDAIDRELEQLRSEKMVLQRENAQLKSKLSGGAEVQQPLDPTEVPERKGYHYTPQQWAFFVERLHFGKGLGLALITLAEENNGQMPPDVLPAAKWLSTNNVQVWGDTGPLYGVGVSSFELVYKGNLRDLEKPERIIMAREVNPVEVSPTLWTRMYVFADGSVQRLEAARADEFANREKAVWPGQP
jgi:hypothetical protein